MAAPLYEFPVRSIDGKPASLKDYEGSVMLIVNVASACGLTPQYEGLEKVYEKYRERGLQVLGFPANDFGAQEPGSNEEIASFCETRFGVKFPMFEKISVRGEGQHPLYRYLTDTQPKAVGKPDSELRPTLKKHGLLGSGKANDVLWNFEKFLVNRHGKVVGRFDPDVTPEDPAVTSAIEAELAKP